MISLTLVAASEARAANFLITIPTVAHGLYSDHPPYGDFEAQNLDEVGFGLVVPPSLAPHETRSAIEFDLSSIPAGAQILHAELILDFVSGSHSVGNIDFYGYVGDGAITRQDILQTALYQGSSESRNVNINVTSFVSSVHATGSRYLGIAGRMVDPDSIANYVSIDYWKIDPSRTRPSLLISLSESHTLPPVKLEWSIDQNTARTLLRLDYSGILQYSYDLNSWQDSFYFGPSPYVHRIDPVSEPRIFWRVRGKLEE